MMAAPNMITLLLTLVIIAVALKPSSSFNRLTNGRAIRRKSAPRMAGDLVNLLDFSVHVPHFADTVVQGLADAAVCPAFGEPGWSLFCGNPAFEAFDAYQAFIENLVVSLHDSLKNFGLVNAYGPSIILFTVLVRLVVSPLTYKQLESSQSTMALNPKIKEVREKYPDKDTQNQMIALLYQEAKVNPLAGCLPALVQIPVFLALYRSFLDLAQGGKLDEPFLWLPNLDGPIYGARSTDWLLKGWQDGVPSLGWHDTLCFLTLPIILIVAQTISLRVLTPPSDDPAVQQSQRILKYLPLLLGYFSLSVPAGLGIYWITNNLLSTVTTVGIKEYFKQNPTAFNIDIDKLANSQSSRFTNPEWGYKSEDQILNEAKEHVLLARRPKIPIDFSV